MICGVKKNKKNSFEQVKYSLVYCLFLVVSLSCSKGGGTSDEPHNYFDPSDNTYPVVTITSPTDDQTFSSPNTINVTGTVSDNSLYQGSISVRNETTGLVVKDQYYEVHYIPSYDFSMACPVTVSVPTDFTISVKFEDHGHNVTGKTVRVKVNP